MELSIPADHPALAGHFPGRPIIPGVVILDAVLDAAAAFAPGQTVTGIEQAKFTAPLLPGQPCTVAFQPGSGGLRFTCTSGERTIASGRLSLASDAP